MKCLMRAAAAIAMIAVTFCAPAHAVCQNARIVSTLFPRGTYSYIYTPHVTPSPSSSSVTDDLVGFFWALGYGGPEFEKGHDSGAFVALGPGRDGWLDHPTGYPATFHTTWGAGRNIDGCIDLVDIKKTCTAVMLSDQFDGMGYYALLTAAPEQGNFSFVQPDNGPIRLAPVPTPEVIETLATASSVRATVRVDLPSQGLFLGSGCSPAVIRGYRLYAQVVKPGETAPVDRERLGTGANENWARASGEDTLTFGTASLVAVDCTPSDDVYIAASLVFDSGFETRYVSGSTAPIRCPD